MAIKPQDVFGSTFNPSTTVLNKPFMQVQEQQPVDTDAGRSYIGPNVRNLNTLVTDGIEGASLSNTLVTLPAGDYYIDAFATAMRTTSHQVMILDSDDNPLILGLSHYSDADNGGEAAVTCAGEIRLTATTIIKLVSYCQIAKTDSWALGYAIPAAGLTPANAVFSQMNIWKLDDVRTEEVLQITDPNMTLAQPLLHVEHREPNGTQGGASAVGDNERTLNNVVTNDIYGASVNTNTNEITLAPGRYSLVVDAYTYDASTVYNTIFLKDAQGNEYCKSLNLRNGVSTCKSSTFGDFTIDETKVMKLYTFSHIAQATNGLGIAYGTGDELYVSLQIRQVDAVVRSPILVNDRLYPLPGNTFVTGNMHGLGYTKTGTNEVTVEPGICMDSTNTEILSLDTVTSVAVPTTSLIGHNIFLCKLTAGGFGVRVDTDINATNVTGIDNHRFIGCVANDSSNELKDFHFFDDMFSFIQPLTVGTLSTSYAQFSLGSFIPVQRVKWFQFGTSSGGALITSSRDGGVQDAETMFSKVATYQNNYDGGFPWGHIDWHYKGSAASSFLIWSFKVHR